LHLDEIKELENLHKLKLEISLTRFIKFETFLKAFEKCPLTHLILLIQVESQEQLSPLADLLKEFKSLQYLKLKINCKDPFNNLEMLQDIFREIDHLSLLKELSISFTSNAQEYQPLLDQDKIFTKIFTKAVPLESFKIELQAFSLSHQGFLELIKSLDLLKATLNKVRIDVGKVKLDGIDLKIVLDFLSGLKNIRCLRLESLNIPENQFFKDLTDILCQMKYLRTLTLGQIQEEVQEETVLLMLKRILQKNGLRKFDFEASYKFKGVPDKTFLAEVKKRNPSLLKTPNISIIAPVYNNNSWK